MFFEYGLSWGKVNVIVIVELKNKFLVRMNCNIDKNLEYNCFVLCFWNSCVCLNLLKGKK